MVVYLEAALDPASKLWGELTVDDRQSAVLSGHGGGFNRRTLPTTTFDALCERSEARNV